MCSADDHLLRSGNFDDVLSVVGNLYARGGVAPGCLMLVSARCRDLLNYRCGFADPGRTTRDTDIAVAVASWDEFERIGASFPSQSDAWQRVAVGGVPVDIVPFGNLEDPPGHIGGIDGGEPRGMDVSGYGRVFSTADEVVIDGIGTLKIPTVAGFALLKLFAWLDRGPRRIHKDASDLSLVLFWYYADTLETLVRRGADCDRRRLIAHFSCRESSALSGRTLDRTVKILLDRLVSSNVR